MGEAAIPLTADEVRLLMSVLERVVENEMTEGLVEENAVKDLYRKLLNLSLTVWRRGGK